MSLNVAHFVELAGEAHPEQCAVKLDSIEISYADLDLHSNRIANMLRDKGIEPGDKVAIMLPNTPHFPLVYYGILKAGATVVPVNVLLKAQEIQYYLEDSDAQVFIVWRGFYDEAVQAFNHTGTCHHLLVASAMDDLEPPPEGELLLTTMLNASAEFDMVETMPDDTAVILYTSGTTGQPKGAELTHFNIFFNAFYARDNIVNATDADVALGVLPLFHSFGQVCIMNACLMAGATLTLVPRFETDKVLEVIERDKVTTIALVPTMYMFILNELKTRKCDLSTIRMAASGGAALPVEVLKAFKEELGIQILEGYGLSETSPVASFNVMDRPCKPGSIGVPIWGTSMKVMREDGSFADIGEVGEIVIRGHNVMKGYYKKPLATEETIVNGWFHTGDMAYMDEEGYFFIVDRKKDIIIRGGMNIYPREIEEVLYGHPAVLEASVLGVPDPIRGEEVKAYISLREGHSATADDLTTYCEERLAVYKVPKFVEFLPELPKGPTGKILKRELRDLAIKGN
jgi:long-chain acyl-CoA synthetase